MVNNKKLQRLNNKGSILLFVVAVIVPLFFGLTTISLDVARISFKRSLIQQALDRTALYGVRFLPNKDDVINGVNTYWRSLGFSNSLIVDVSEDRVVVKSQEAYSPIFGSFFKEVGLNFIIPLPTYSVARVVPNDVALVLDRGIKVAPAIFSSAANSWGDENIWGAASLFNNEINIVKNGVLINSRIATQQCFNPIFNSLKSSLINSLVHLGSFNLNRVSILTSPGARGDIGVVRKLSFLDSSTPTLLDGYTEWDNDHYVTVYEDEESDSFPVKSIHCAAIADEEQYFSDYRFPYLISGFESHLVDHSTWNISDSYPLKFDQIVWSKVSHSEKVMDFREVLRSLMYNLLLASYEDRRGGLSLYTRKTALVFSADIPFVDGIRFDNLTSTQINLLTNEILLYANECSHQKLNCTLLFITLGEFNAIIDSVQIYFDELVQGNEELKSHLSIKIISSPDKNELTDKIISTLLIGGQYAMLAT